MIATDFAIRKTGQVFYVLPKHQDYTGLMVGLGKHETGKFCLYLKRNNDANLEVLDEPISRGLPTLQTSMMSDYSVLTAK
jgi:hypothetical protein